MRRDGSRTPSWDGQVAHAIAGPTRSPIESANLGWGSRVSDLRFRETRRRWLETKTPATEADYLRECVRVGCLEPQSLELAAFCGREGAVWALGGFQNEEDPERWVFLLGRWGLRAVAAAAASFVKTAATGVCESDSRRAWVEVVEAVQEWISSGNNDSRQRAIAGGSLCFNAAADAAASDVGTSIEPLRYALNISAYLLSTTLEPTGPDAPLESLARRVLTTCSVAVDAKTLVAVARDSLGEWVVSSTLTHSSAAHAGE